MRHKRQYQPQRQQWLVAIVGALLLGALSTAWGETCPSQKLVHVRPSDIGVTHVQMLGQVSSMASLSLAAAGSCVCVCVCVCVCACVRP